MHPRFPVLCRIFFAALLALYALPAKAQSIPADSTAAVILAYQDVGDDDAPDGISLEQFSAQMAELRAGGYHVLPLKEILAAKGKVLPARAIGITFDTPSPGTIKAVTPLLAKAGFPFAVFIAPAENDAAGLSWDDARVLAKKGVTLGLTVPEEWSEKPDSAVLNRLVAQYRETLKTPPQLFAWPQGIYADEMRALLKPYAFTAIFGGQGGTLYTGADRAALPRFMMTDETEEGLERFRLIAGALPLPVEDTLPSAPLPAADNPPVIGFNVMPEIRDLSRLTCFVSGYGQAEKILLPDNRVELRIARPVEGDKARVNCTLPVFANEETDKEDPSRAKAWRWFGMMLTLKTP